VERQTTDFQGILTELKDWGVNDYELERRTGLGRSMLTKLRMGQRKQPNYDDGCLILQVWKKEKRKQSPK